MCVCVCVSAYAYVYAYVYWILQGFHQCPLTCQTFVAANFHKNISSQPTHTIDNSLLFVCVDLGIGDDPVYYGFIAPIVWFVIFTVVASLGVHLRRF